MKFRRHRWVANDRSGPDEGLHAQAIEVGPFAGALDLVKVSVLRQNLATWSDVTSVIMISSLSQLAWLAWCVCVRALERLGLRPASS